MTEPTLTKFYGAIDDGRLEEALALLHEKVSFVIVLPTGARRGQGREDMRGYLSGRGVPDRKHKVLRESRGQRRRIRLRGGDRGPRHDRALPGGRAARCGLPDHQLPGVLRLTGDHAGLVAYLEQREQSVLVHHVTHGSRVGNVELVLGQTTRNSSFEASFNASALLDADADRCRRLLICRTPEVEFPHA